MNSNRLISNGGTGSNRFRATSSRQLLTRSFSVGEASAMQCTTTLLTRRENPRAVTRSGLPEASSELLYISFRTKGALASAPSRIRYAALLKSGLCLCFAVVGVMALPEDRAYLCSPRIATLRLNFKVRVFAAQPPQNAPTCWTDAPPLCQARPCGSDVGNSQPILAHEGSSPGCLAFGFRFGRA